MNGKSNSHQEKAKPNGKRMIRLEQSQKLIMQAEKILDGPLLTYWNSENGVITREDAEAFHTLLAGMKFCPKLYLCLTSKGGTGLASLRIATLLRSYCKSLIVLVPVRAESAATMLALAADEIQLAPQANLSPVDTSIQHALSPLDHENDHVSVGQDELARIVSLWQKEAKNSPSNLYPELWRYIHPLVIGAVDRANSLSLKLCDALMSFHISDAKVRQKIAETLTMAYPTHAYPILLQETKAIGIPAKAMAPELENILSALLEYYYEAGKFKRTDRDKDYHHDDEIAAFIERTGKIAYFRLDRDWYYRPEEKRWTSMHVNNGWYLADLIKNKVVEKPLNIG
ncbi:MAG: hypothetical protein PHC61_08120 [Chitinivibrionales bacterium]|nr:hypothetical protein [Chitinivibrionales bacterium]